METAKEWCGKYRRRATSGPTVEEAIEKYQQLAFFNTGIPANIFNVRTLPPWAIDAGCD